jgi:hypothetical protein
MQIDAVPTESLLVPYPGIFYKDEIFRFSIYRETSPANHLFVKYQKIIWCKKLAFLEILRFLLCRGGCR